MKQLIRDEVLFYKNHYPKATRLIQRLQQLTDKDELTLDDFKDTGVIMKRIEFESTYCTSHRINLHKDCTDVCRYIGGLHIQLLKTGRFYLKYKNYRARYADGISKLESALWKYINQENNN